MISVSGCRSQVFSRLVPLLVFSVPLMYLPELSGSIDESLVKIWIDFYKLSY